MLGPSERRIFRLSSRTTLGCFLTSFPEKRLKIILCARSSLRAIPCPSLAIKQVLANN